MALTGKEDLQARKLYNRATLHCIQPKQLQLMPSLRELGGPFVCIQASTHAQDCSYSTPWQLKFQQDLYIVHNNSS